jgi:hypothetical protein
LDGDSKHPVDDRKVKFKQNQVAGTKKNNIIWTLTITILSFSISLVLTVVSSNILKEAEIITAFLVIFLIILVNITFDIIGTAVTAADETPFHAMASRKLYGAKQAIFLIRNADKVSNFCNDVVGDICGVISGTAAAFIVYKFMGGGSGVENSIFGLMITAFVASFTVGGKAMGKAIALQNSNYIVYKVGVILKFLFGKLSRNNKKRNNK